MMDHVKKPRAAQKEVLGWEVTNMETTNGGTGTIPINAGEYMLIPGIDPFLITSQDSKCN